MGIQNKKMKVVVAVNSRNVIFATLKIAGFRCDVELDSSWCPLGVLETSKAETFLLHNQPRAFTLCPGDFIQYFLRSIKCIFTQFKSTV